MVVISILLVVSITDLGPIIFLRLSEKGTGEYDGTFYNSHYTDPEDFGSFVDKGYYINYENVMQEISTAGKSFNLAPRVQFCDSTVQYNDNDNKI